MSSARKTASARRLSSGVMRRLRLTTPSSELVSIPTYARIIPIATLPFPVRLGEPHQVMGVKVSPIVGSRGCYADCSFCCIFAYAENADGARYRRRSPENVFEEMRREYVERGARLFVFQDDNFFVPAVAKNLERYRRLGELLDGAGMGDIGLVIKCRPNDVVPELFRLLKSMG